jgi:NAD(P)-dependent dehydrogenase (short-subunit alcohol dehydrogenase family)
MTKPLEHEVIIITGASRGIGAATALECASQGAKVVLAARSRENLESITKAITTSGGQALAVACDVTNYSDVEHVVKVALEHYNTITGVINNAGVIEPIAHLEDGDAETWAQTIQINLLGAYHLTRAVLPHFYSMNRGVIVNLSSGAAHKALEGWSAYCASKAGLAMLTKSIALEAEGRGVYVYGFAPGLVDTDMQGRIRESGMNAVSRLPREELSRPDKVARAMAWFCKHKPSDIHGQELDIRNRDLRIRMGLEVNA